MDIIFIIKPKKYCRDSDFHNADLQRPYQEFSGGWRMRVLLAKMILQQPDLLLLDEPTNHLDLPSIEWLEKYLQHYQGSVVIVSHDKYFLNRMVTKIVELYQQELHIYNGNFDYYRTGERTCGWKFSRRHLKISRIISGSRKDLLNDLGPRPAKAAAAQSALKRLEKLERIEDVELERPNIKINFQVDKTRAKFCAH